MSQLDAIQSITNFNPTKIDLFNPSHLGNWISRMF